MMPCDADPLVQPNHVSATLVQLYAGLQPVSAVMPPTATQDVPCAPSQDHLVTFDFSVIRSANQGFFDIKATVEDIFCAAKADVQAAQDGMSAAQMRIDLSQKALDALD